MPASAETFSNEAVITWASENPEQQLLVAQALAQRALNLRQELSEQETPNPEELVILERVLGVAIRPEWLPYEALKGLDIPPLFQDPTLTFKGAWGFLARCLGEDPDIFFPELHASGKERDASVERAKELCGECIVRETCLEYALIHGEKFGIYGGKTERERRRIRRQRIRDGGVLNNLLELT